MNIDHIGIAVKSLEQAIKVYETAIGLQVTGFDQVEDQGVRVAMLAVGENTEEQLRAEAKKKHLAWITVRRAKTKLGIHSVKQGFQGA